MSHFLERLASGVTQPTTAKQPALRPMAGSIYAPQQSRDADASVALQAEETTEMAASSARRNAALEREKSTLSHRGERVFAEESRSSARCESSHGQPLAERLLPAVEKEMRGIAETGRGNAARREEAGEPEWQKQREVSEARLDLHTAIDLLMKPSRSEDALPVPQAGDSQRAVREEPARRSSQLPREPDEITINIGRIEVAALQQIVRPMAAPQRKAMSLDEYLKRGNGRAG
ncbi:MAG TPA: hypothetical protein VHD85_20685 [Terracidiphilus sp.]|nr:hypothetical protein [Terracidiphilus sp.]